MACGFNHYTNQPRPEWLAALAETASIDIDALAAITRGQPDSQYGWWRGQRFSQNVLDRRGTADRRICPACLIQSAHHRQIWDIKYIAVCPIHRCLLIDECAKCGRPLQWHGREIVRCRCKLDLRSLHSPEVAAPEAEVTAAVYGLLGERSFKPQADLMRAMPPFRNLAGSDIADFLFRLGLERLGRRKKVFSTENVGEFAWEAHIALRLGLEAVQDWPDGLEREIDNMRERWGGDGAKSLFRCAGAIEFWLSRLQPGSCGTAIKAAIIDYRAQDAKRKGRDVLARTTTRER